MTTYIVNGLTIEESSSGKTGYLGSSVSSSWRPRTPFIAALGLPSDDSELLELIERAPDATSLHLGSYDDSRKAAYVAAYYRNDPEAVLLELLDGDIDISFPADLFKLPEYITLAEAQVTIEENKKKKQKPLAGFNKAKAEKAINKIYNIIDYKMNDQDTPNALAAMEALYLTRVSYSNAAAEVMKTYHR